MLCSRASAQLQPTDREPRSPSFATARIPSEPGWSAISFVARNSVPLAQPHPRNLLCAHKRAIQPNRRELHFSPLPTAGPEPYSPFAVLYNLRNFTRATSVACRNRGAQLHFVPLASGRRLCI